MALQAVSGADVGAQQDNQEFPKVSAIVLSFNRCDETLGCLASLTRQTYGNVEITILDNGSKDDSVDAIRREYPGLKLICMPKNYGDWEGRDIAAKNCSGDYLMFIDNDAVMEEDTIAKLVEQMELDHRIAVVQARVVDPDTGEPEGMGEHPERVNINHYRATFLGGAALIRAETFHHIGGFPHYLLGGGELFVSLRILDLGQRILHYSGTTILHKKSTIERVPSQRLFLATKQRLRAVMSHFPGVMRPLLELGWKTTGYAIAAMRCGYVWRIPLDLPRLTYAGLREWRGDWIIKRRTVHLHDYLLTHFVTKEKEYDAMSLERGHFFAVVRRHLPSLRRRVPGKLSSHG